MSLARAIATGDLAELPSRRDEDWRWTDLRGLIRAMPPASPASEGPTPPAVFAAETQLRVINGRGPDEVTVGAGETRTLALRFIAASSGTAHVSAIRIVVGEGARLTLLETYEALAGGCLAEADLDIALGAGAALERVVLTADAEDGVLVSTAVVTMGPGARFAQTALSCGGRRQRLETRVSHPGAGAGVRLDGVYLLAARRHADITTVVTHAGLDGATDQLVKGVVQDQARGVFQGRIVVREGADRTDARMGHHALVLSDRAEVDAKPELEIFADDVACAHGNTVGALDEEALFYAAQRGIPEPQARALLTEAFVGEVIDRIEDEGAREVARAWAAGRLRATP
ncbi:MAG: Fe-S cluster assembly protein SufD [Caulobacteraceae bacterium]|nr:Fe-S cluster assembly protein SufD [Caulobacteraceae bacterium]